MQRHRKILKQLVPFPLQNQLELLQWPFMILWLPILVDEFFEISKVVLEIEREEHFDVEDQPYNKGVQVELIGYGEDSHCFATLEVQLIDVADEVRQNLGLLEVVRDLLYGGFDLPQFLLVEVLSFYLLPMHLTSVLRVILLLFSLKLTHTKMRAHDVYPLQFPSDHRCLTTADIIIFGLTLQLMTQLCEWFEHAEVFDVLIYAILECLVPDIGGSDAVPQ